MGQLAYQLDLPEDSKVHPVFHVSQLKPHVPDHSPVFSTLPPGLALDFLFVEPEGKLVKKGNVAHLQALVKWSSMPETMATWEE